MQPVGVVVSIPPLLEAGAAINRHFYRFTKISCQSSSRNQTAAQSRAHGLSTIRDRRTRKTLEGCLSVLVRENGVFPREFY